MHAAGCSLEEIGDFVGHSSGFSSRPLLVRAFVSAPSRGDVVVFTTPGRAAKVCGAGGTFVKRLIGLPGERVAERNGVVFVNGEKLDEPYVKAGRPRRRDRTLARTRRGVLPDGRQSLVLMRLPGLGLGAARADDREGREDLQAALVARIPRALSSR
jgi:hypothetical protein